MHVPDGNKPIKVGDPSFIYKGVYHPIYWLGTDPYRPRVETLTIKDGMYVYANMKPNARLLPSNMRNHAYSIPGGSLDIDSTKIKQAEAETNEEALISITGIYPTGIQYYEEYDKGFLLKGGDMPLEYVGSVSDVFVAKYAGIYDKSKVEEKDLDPDMANKGKFHRIDEIADILRKEHVDALLASPYVDDHMKSRLLLNNRVVVGESANPTTDTKKIYHGSTYKIDAFKPMSLDLGNAFQDPGWSTFCFLDYTQAKLFGTMRAFQTLLQSTELTSDETLKKELTMDILNGQLVISEDCLNLIKDTDLISTKVKFYVYTIDASNLDTCVGNDPYLPEVTFREENVLPITTDCYETSILDLKEEIGLLNDSICNLDNYRKEQNPYAEFNTHNYRTEEVRKTLEKAVKDGELKPGDDILEYMANHDLSFDSDDIHIPDLTLELDEPVLESSVIPVLEKAYPLDCYGLPGRKAYPMPDKKHVLSAIKFFNYADAKEEQELAANINKKIAKFHMTDIRVGPTNRFRKYYKPKKKGSSGKKIPKGSKPKKNSIMETRLSGKKNKHYTPKDKINIVSYTKVKGKAKYLKEENPALLMHVRDDADTVIWYSKISELPVGYIATEKKPDGIWITALEVSEKFRGHGLSKQMIQVATKELGATKLSVAKSNKVAYDMYKESFDVYDENDDMYFMKIVDEAYAMITSVLYPVMEADGDENDGDEEDEQLDEPATDYTGDVEEEESGEEGEDTETEEEDEPTEGEGKEDEQLDEPATDYTGDVEEEPESEPDEDEPDTVDTTDNIDTDTNDTAAGEDGDEEPLGGEPTDYTEEVDGGGDTGDTDKSVDDVENGDNGKETEDTEYEDSAETEDSAEDEKNKSRFDNKELKNYFLLNDFLSVHELITDISDSLNGVILQTPEANSVLAKVIKNLQDILIFTENFIQFQFSDTDYPYNLYYYNIIVSTLKINLELLKETISLGETKK